MLEKIKLWWRFEGRYYYKDFIQGVKNLYKWFPTIWKDRNWDSTYIYKILQFKLEQQAYHIGSNDRHTTAKRDAERMMLCARLCYIQQEESYEIEYLDYIDQEHEFIPTDETNKWYTIESTTIKDNLDEYFALYPRQYKLALEGKIAWYGEPTDGTDRKEMAMCIAYNNQKRSHELLFKILEHQIKNWWD